MASTKPTEFALLEPCRKSVIEGLSHCAPNLSTETLHEILEAAACQLGGTNVIDLWSRDQYEPQCDIDTVLDGAKRVCSTLVDLPYHPALALASLAQPTFSFSEKRSLGAYYTDYRLARFLSKQCRNELKNGGLVIDPSVGTGALLVAAVLTACGADHTARDIFIQEKVFAADVNESAIRGTRLSLLSMATSLDVVPFLNSHLKVIDSLELGPDAWAAEAPGGFNVVIGNPPWEKLKLSRHEYHRSKGKSRHYGEQYYQAEDNSFRTQRDDIRTRAKTLSKAYTLTSNGDVDLYQAFLELAIRLCCPHGRVAMLLPAGLIRSHGASLLRNELIHRSGSTEVVVFDNRARFFSIDSRFKFIALNWTPRKSPRNDFKLSFGRGVPDGIAVSPGILLPSDTLKKSSDTFGVPEVRTRQELQVFGQMLKAGPPMSSDDCAWKGQIVRELDMTRDSDLFERDGERDYLPLIEGRMVHQYRCNNKAYVSGSGRKALWVPQDSWLPNLMPQFWVNPSKLTQSVNDRTKYERVGFCDITGQTNERSMMATLIPTGVVCGNKVPTIMFENSSSASELSILWTAIANSFAFDWFLRRVITTTVNFFILRNMPLPQVGVDSLMARRICRAVLEIQAIQARPITYELAWNNANLRAEIDLLVLRAYGLHVDQVALILDDFPQLDKRQPALPSETRSTVTRDILLELAYRNHNNKKASDHSARVHLARELGAVPYVVNESAKLIVDHGLESEEGECNGFST